MSKRCNVNAINSELSEWTEAFLIDRQVKNLSPNTIRFYGTCLSKFTAQLHENKRATGDEQFIPLEDWDSCVDATHRPLLPTFEQHLFVGVDASVKHDCAAVVAAYHDQE